jgi:predicted DNA-binding transcriptional regulator YafY
MSDEKPRFSIPSEESRRRIKFTYTNHRGELAQRQVRPVGIVFTATEWRPEPQWLLNAFDMEKRVNRLFAMKDMRNVRYV